MHQLPLRLVLVFCLSLLWITSHTQPADQCFLIDFGPIDETSGSPTLGPDVYGHFWTNISNPAADASPVQLISSTNETTGYELSMVDALQNNEFPVLGLENPDTAALGELGIATATQDLFLSSNSGSIRIDGLDIGNGYRFHIFGSSAYTGPRRTAYTLSGFNGSTGVIQTSGTDLSGPGQNENRLDIYTSDIIFPDDNGSIAIEVKVELGQFAYINALRMEEYFDMELCPEVNDRLIAVMGSSVARGQGAPGDQGYAYQYSQLLDERATTGEGMEWEVSNISVGGNTTVHLLDRWATDLAPLCGKYVIYGLSLANEGILSQGQAAFDQFRDNMQILIDRAKARHLIPVVVGNYARNGYGPVEYDFIKQMNLLIHQWDVASVNVLGALDNGSGNWVSGYSADAGHPNLLGHTEFFHAFVPSLFDALAADKSQPERVPNAMLSFGSDLASEPILFTPEHSVHAFTFSLGIRTEQTGKIMEFGTTDGVGRLEINAAGKLVYHSPSGESISSDESVNDGAWQQITLTHYYAQGRSELYLDDLPANEALTEQLLLEDIAVSGPDAPDLLDLRDMFFYRSAMNQEEITALVNGHMLKSSLELYAPLDEQASNPIVNLAQSTNTLSNDILNDTENIEAPRGAFRFYPNPTRDRLNIESLSEREVGQLDIFNAQGQKILSTWNKNSVELGHLPTGMYWVHLPGLNISYKLLKN